MAQELNSEMTEEEQERMLKSGMGVGGGLNAGETELFAKKLTKEEKKALAEQKKAEREAKKEAEKALQAKIARNRAIENGEAPPEEEEEEAPASSAPAKKLTAKEKKAAKEAAKNGGTGVEGSFGELDLDDGGAFKHAICTAVLLSRKDSRDIKIGSFSISLFGQLLFDDQILELTYGHRYGLVAQVPTSLHGSTSPDGLSTDAPIRRTGLLPGLAFRPTYLPTYLPTDLPMCPPAHLPTCLTYLYLPTYPRPTHPHTPPTAPTYRTARVRARCSSASRRARCPSRTSSTSGSSTARRNRQTGQPWRR